MSKNLAFRSAPLQTFLFVAVLVTSTSTSIIHYGYVTNSNIYIFYSNHHSLILCKASNRFFSLVSFFVPIRIDFFSFLSDDWLLVLLVNNSDSSGLNNDYAPATSSINRINTIYPTFLIFYINFSNSSLHPHPFITLSIQHMI